MKTATSTLTICARYARLSVQKRRRAGEPDDQGSVERQLAAAAEFVEKIGGALGPAYPQPQGTSGGLPGKTRDGAARRPAWGAMPAGPRGGELGAVGVM